jgi:predicted ribosomally synthesized peptide with SipW-like signal peptide
MARHRLPTRRPGLLRLRAVLAGGLVLGVGAAVTLAAWTDREYGTGTFTASTFDTESTSAATSTGWASNASSPGATLQFNATSMSPGSLQYATLNVRTTLATNVSGNVVLTSATTTGTLPAVLEYRAVRTTATTTTCNAATFTSGTYIAGSNAPAYQSSSTVPVAVQSPIAAANGEIRYCFEVRMAPTAASTYQGATGTITWLFTATSVA